MRERTPGVPPPRWALKAYGVALAALATMRAPDLGGTATWSPAPVQPDQYGFDEGQYERALRAPSPGETLAGAMRARGVGASKVARAGELAEACCKMSGGRAGAFLIYTDRQTGLAPVFIQRADVSRYVVFDFRDSVSVYEGFYRPVVQRRSAQGEIGEHQDSTLAALLAHDTLAAILARVMAWQVDFHRLRRGDRFFVIYEEEQSGGITTRLDVLAARVLHNGQDHRVYGFAPDDSHLDYYDEHGNAVRRQFLRAPIEYTRVSSAFSQRRLHPTLHRYKPHLGTDLAAPEGTPIVATAAGTVSASGWTERNGHYVRLEHADTFATAYLHMAGRAVRAGQHVRQGGLIGYVGATGTATGPHVCYRMWQNGQAVDALRLVQPPPATIAPGIHRAFRSHRDSLHHRLGA